MTSSTSDRPPPATRIAFIGGGNMAYSLIGGLMRAGAAAAQISVAEPNEELHAKLTRDFGVDVHVQGVDAARRADAIVLAIKPQVMKAVCLSLQGIAQQRKPLIVSWDPLESTCRHASLSIL